SGIRPFSHGGRSRPQREPALRGGGGASARDRNRDRTPPALRAGGCERVAGPPLSRRPFPRRPFPRRPPSAIRLPAAAAPRRTAKSGGYERLALASFGCSTARGRVGA